MKLVGFLRIFRTHDRITSYGCNDIRPTFRVDLTKVARKLEILRYGSISDLPVNIQVIDNQRDLRDWVAQMREQNNKLYSDDCEWHGNQHIDGDLRSIQFCWNATDAVYIKFRSEQNEWCFEFNEFPEGSWIDNPPPGMEEHAGRIRDSSGKLWEMDFHDAFALVKEERDESGGTFFYRIGMEDVN